jgi:DNA-binding NtrC family response regulator
VKRRVLCIGTHALAEPLIDALDEAGWDAQLVGNLPAARRWLAENKVLVGVLLQAEPTAPECTALDAFLAAHPDMEWVGCFGAAALQLPSCRDLVLTYLFDHHTLPLDLPRVLDCVGHAHGRAMLHRVAGDAGSRPGEEHIIGRSPAMTELLRQVRRIARTGAPVLIQGESGSGKELIAQLLHRNSARAGGPFVAVNCAAIQATLIQSELFGHERGAFTGAVSEKRGLFETANKGTLFLDEIGDLSLDLQANLLRFLEEGTINRVGSERSIKLDVRVLAATHVDLEHAVASGAFRHDLFYRLNVVPLRVMPLRERREDIEALALYFFQKFSAEKNPRIKGFSRPALAAMEAYAWPGNVREMINRLRRAMIMAEGRCIRPGDLGLETPPAFMLENVLDDARLKAERSAIASTLQRTGRNVAVAARQLGVSRMTLYRLMVKHGMTASR